MTKLRKGKGLGIAAACLLVASLAGALVAPAILAQEVPSVSIDPEAQDVVAGETFTIDVWVDAGDNNLRGIGVVVQYDSDAMTTSGADIEAHNDLLGPDGMPMMYFPRVTDGEVEHAIVTTTAQAGVDGSLMTITFTMDAGAVPGVYPLTITEVDMVDENIDPVAVETNDGTVTIPGAPAPEGPSVSIDPETQDVVAGNTFTIDVLVDADGNDLMGIDVAVQYDSDAMTTSGADITAHDDLLGDGGMPLWGFPRVTDGKVRHAIVNPVAAQAGVEGSLMSIEFTVNEDAVPGDYALTITLAELADGGGELIPDVAENDGTVTVLPAGPVIFDDTFPGALAEGDRDFICTIPVGASDLAIDLITAASPGPDMDLELSDGATLVIGYGGEIGSAPGGSYEGDDFGYSGWYDGEESINADGPLGQTYDLEVYAFEPGTYTVTVYYEIPEGVDVTPPEIDIEVTASTLTVGEPLTVMVTADDPSDVQMVMFMVSSSWPGGWSAASSLAAPQQDYEDIVQFVMSFSDEASVTFVPGWAGTYTVDAWAVDNEDNMTPEGSPVTEDFEVVA